MRKALTGVAWKNNIMIYFYHGDKEKILREKVHALITSLEKKRPEAEIFTFTTENVSASFLEELSESGGLFDPKHIVFLDHVCEGLDLEEGELKRIIPLLQASESVFIILEQKLSAPHEKLIVKHAEKTVHLSQNIKSQKETFNMFALTDALLGRDKIKLWTLYLEAIHSGEKPEDIHGILFWQAKSMALAHKTKSAKEAGLKPFVYSKSKKGETSYSDYEIERMPWSLVEVLHRARLESEDFELSLERWVLAL